MCQRRVCADERRDMRGVRTSGWGERERDLYVIDSFFIIICRMQWLRPAPCRTQPDGRSALLAWLDLSTYQPGSYALRLCMHACTSHRRCSTFDSEILFRNFCARTIHRRPTGGGRAASREPSTRAAPARHSSGRRRTHNGPCCPMSGTARAHPTRMRMPVMRVSVGHCER